MKAPDPLEETPDVQFLPPLDLPVLGVPTRFLSTDPELDRAVRETFGGWAPLRESPGVLSPARVRVRLIGHDAMDDAPPATVHYRRPARHRAVFQTEGSTGAADLAAGEAVARVSPALVADEAHFRYAFLSALVLITVTAHDRVPIHAAAVSRQGVALLLHGPSGVGKSSLALACAERGMTLLSEDVVYAELTRGPRLWGMPGPIHVTADSLRFFPGRTPARSVVRSAGMRKFALPVGPGETPRPLFAERVGLCVLQRSLGAPVLEPTSEDRVRALLGSAAEPGFDGFATQAARAAPFVAGEGAWRLQVGADPHEAARLLSDLAQSLS